MRLVVDTNVLVGDLLRGAGRERLGDPRLEVFLPEAMWEEAQVEVPRRVAGFARRHGLAVETADELVHTVLAAVGANVSVIDRAVCAGYEEEARARSVRDRFDWPLVACALALDAAVWTHDTDLFGTGVATWTTTTLTSWLIRHEDAGPAVPG